MERRKYIAIVSAAAVVIVVAVCVYLAQLSATVAGNLMTSVDEISRHDVETIEGTLNNCYARLGSVADRLEVYDVQTLHEAQEQLNLEAASSAMFNAVYLMEADGTLYSSSYVRLGADEHAYDELMEDGREHFAMLYDDENGRLETTKESLIFGIRLPDTEIGGRTFVAMLARSDLSTISSQLVIESFDGQGVSSVVNARGYYIVSASPATDLAGRDNFYDTLEAGRIDDGVTVEDIRRNIAAGGSFVINCTTSAGEGSRHVLRAGRRYRVVVHHDGSDGGVQPALRPLYRHDGGHARGHGGGHLHHAGGHLPVHEAVDPGSGGGRRAHGVPFEHEP